MKYLAEVEATARFADGKLAQTYTTFLEEVPTGLTGEKVQALAYLYAESVTPQGSNTNVIRELDLKISWTTLLPEGSDHTKE